MDLRPPSSGEILALIVCQFAFDLTVQLNQLFEASFCKALFPLLHRGEPGNETSLFMCIIV